MSRQLEQKQEERKARRDKRVLLAVNGGLEAGVERAGGRLHGFSVKLSEYDCLLTLRAEFPGGAMVAFVGGADLPDVLLKGSKAAKTDGLRWKKDKWARS